VETQEQLVSLLDRLLESSGVSVALGEELAEPGLRHFALVAAPYGAASGPLGVLGVIGPRRMDYRHVIPLVSYCSERVTEKLEP
jgi:heat-inducible transcriptional repressor